MRTLMIAGIVVAASTGTALAQDAAAGEQVFKRLCSPCHDIGPDAKVKLGPPLNGIDGRKAGIFEGFNYSPANKSWTLRTCGPTSSNSGLTGRRNENRRAQCIAPAPAP